ncbi:alpha/beta hydrolase [Sphingosinicella terrae]|uniref:alpha/beta hydrolase n=1 Tax=Sphingosinicella terrae TaxID=2172047 RepID=UPI000E0E0604|nr:alpha/beta hydrolase [Sphingosinicella terrae]
MKLDRRTALLGTLALGLSARAAAQVPPPLVPGGRTLSFPDPTETIELWPAGAPGLAGAAPRETVTERSTDPGYNDRIVTGIARPRMAAFRPERPNGATVLLIPGGGYQRVVIDKEGYEMARLLAGRGITAFVLFYRLPHEGWLRGADVPLADAQRAVRLLRARAAGFGLDPTRLCVMGFSAGGHVCASLLARFGDRSYDPIDEADRLSARPDAAAPIYPVVSMTPPLAHEGSRSRLIGDDPPRQREQAYSPHRHVKAGSPPTFLLHAEDDESVPVGNTLLLREALRDRGVPVETHLFPDGGHGFGIRLARGHSVEHWPDLFLAWGRTRNLWS